MQHPKTTLLGYIGLVGTLLGAIGTAIVMTAPSNAWGQALMILGTAIKGADSLGNIASQDGGH